jgi:hypothetical protein
VFEQKIEFEYCFKNSNSSGLKAWLVAEFNNGFPNDQVMITWVIRNEIRLGKGTGKDPYYKAVVAVADHNLHLGSGNREWVNRLVTTKALELLPLIVAAANRTGIGAAGSMLWNIFCGLYYPHEGVDHFNSWIVHNAPELHEICLREAHMRNMQVVSEIHAT